MTVVTIPLRPRPSWIQSVSRAAVRVSGRLLRLELRRSAMLWMLPPVVTLFWFDSYRTAMAMPPFWVQRAMATELHSVIDFAPLLAGVSAWTGSRDGRRRTADMLAGTARPRWTARLVTWAAGTGLAVAAYLCCVGAVYLATARQADWGGPVWWPAAVGAATVTAACALGFAAGVLVPSRLTAPLAAVVVFGALFTTLRPVGSSAFALISPVNSSLGLNLFADIGVFYHYLPDLAIVQVMFMAGLTTAALGVLGLPRVCGGRWLRGVALVVTAAGLALTGTAAGLTGSAQLDVHDMVVIPAVHDAASDAPVPYTGVCSRAAGVPFCVHPAFRAYLPEVQAALAPVLRQVAGLPGSPVRVSQVATTTSFRPGLEARLVGGHPPVVAVALGPYLTDPSALTGSLRQDAAPAIVASVIGGLRGVGYPARQAVEGALLQAAGVPPSMSSSSVYAAAARFAALPASVRHAWLAAHLPALRAGHITLEQLP